MRYSQTMKKYQTFGAFWEAYFDRSVKDRANYLVSLSKEEKSSLIKSLFDDGWDKLIAQNIVDERLDFIKNIFHIDLLDMRIQAIKYGRTFFVDRYVWELIEQSILEFEDFYDTNLLFGGLTVAVCGRSNQFCRIQKSQGE